MLKTLLPFALLLTTTPVLAADAVSEARLHVSYADLNLATADGRTKFDRRIAKAIDTLCPAPTSKSLKQALEVQHCRTTAEASVVPQRAQALASVKAGKIEIASGR